jgi:plasmid stability protein
VANLTIRDLAPAVAERLAARAAAHGTTVENEARAILEQAILGPDIGELALELYGPRRDV